MEKEKLLNLYKKRLISSRSELKFLGICVYGTFYIGKRSKNSDIDIIAICENKGIEEHNREFLEGEEIHCTIISYDLLKKDAKEFYLGSLYINKFINPHLFIYKEKNIQCKVYHLLKYFLEKYAFQDIFVENKPLSIEKIISRVYLLHLNNFPHYILNLVKIFDKKDRLQSLSEVKKIFLQSLNSSKNILSKEGKYFFKSGKDNSFRPFFHEKIRISWWQIYQNYRGEKNFLIKQIKKEEKNIIKNKWAIKKTYDYFSENGRI